MFNFILQLTNKVLYDSIPESMGISIGGSKTFIGSTGGVKFTLSSWLNITLTDTLDSNLGTWNVAPVAHSNVLDYRLALIRYLYNGVYYIEAIHVEPDGYMPYSLYNSATFVPRSQSFPLTHYVGTPASVSLPYSIPAEAIDAGVVLDGVGDMAIDDVISLDLDGTGVTDLVLNPSIDGSGTVAIPTQIDVLRDWDVPLSVPLPPAIPPDLPDMPDLDNYVLPDVTQLFPFCIPFDLIALFDVLNAEPVVPRFVMPLDFGFVGVNHDLVIDLSDFDGVAAVCRWGSMILFLLGLVLSTRKLIKG